MIVTPSEVEYLYDLHEDSGYDVFPLQDGNGDYTIRVFRQHECGRYEETLTTTIDVTLADELSPFIYPNQFAGFTADCIVVHKAAILTANLDAHADMIEVITDFIAASIIYEISPESIENGYIPEPNEVLRKGRGTCFDISVLMVSMLRSQGIPAKLIMGYVCFGTGESLYHAWVEIHNGETWELHDPTFSTTFSLASLLNPPNYSEEFVF